MNSVRAKLTFPDGSFTQFRMDHAKFQVDKISQGEDAGKEVTIVTFHSGKIVTGYSRLDGPKTLEIESAAGISSEAQAALAILRANAPMPFYLEQDNNEGTVVKDNHGEPIFVEWENLQETRMLPEEETIIRRSRRSALARFLVEISQMAQK